MYKRQNVMVLIALDNHIAKRSYYIGIKIRSYLAINNHRMKRSEDCYVGSQVYHGFQVMSDAGVLSSRSDYRRS